MNPFEQAPTTEPVSTDPPLAGPVGPASGRRGRMAIVALATAGLIGGGVVVVSQFASADEPALLSSDSTTSTTLDDASGDEPAGEPSGQSSDESVDGQIVIDVGEGQDPIVLDLGDLGGSFGQLSECLGLPMFGPMFDDPTAGEPGSVPPVLGGDLGDRLGPMIERMLENLDLENLDLGNLDLGGPGGPMLGDLGMFGTDGSKVTVMGPDGLSVIDLGDGDGSVTITQTDGALAITTDGDATVHDLSDFSEMIPFDDLQTGDFNLGDLNLGDFNLGDLDSDAIQSCLEQLG